MNINDATFWYKLSLITSRNAVNLTFYSTFPVFLMAIKKKVTLNMSLELEDQFVPIFMENLIRKCYP